MNEQRTIPAHRVETLKPGHQHAPRLVLGTGVCPHCGGKSVHQDVAGNYSCLVCGWWQYNGRQAEV